MGLGGSKNPLQAMAKPIDIESFMGKWYVISHIPTYVEKNAYNAVEFYKYDPAASAPIDVMFKFNSGSFEGPQRELAQKGWIHNKSTNAEWRVSPKLMGFSVPVKLPYIILSCEDDYSSTVIGYPSRAYLWIMSRTPTMSSESYDKALALAKESGYDLTHLRKVPQQEAAPHPEVQKQEGKAEECIT